jgi:1,6-anhydro-N-acetylmuramate kinase
LKGWAFTKNSIALREAQQLPILAEQDAQAIVQKALSEAQEEARKLVLCGWLS